MADISRRKILPDKPDEQPTSEPNSVPDTDENNSTSNSETLKVHEKRIQPSSSIPSSKNSTSLTFNDDDQNENINENGSVSSTTVETRDSIGKDEPNNQEDQDEPKPKDQSSENPAKTDDTDHDNDFQPHWRKHQKVPSRIHRRKKLWSIVIVLLVIIAICAYPLTRHWLLKKSGLKRSFQLTFVDQATNDPVSGLNVTLGGQTNMTNQNGQATFKSVHLGNQNISATEPGYAPLNSSLSLEPWSRYKLPVEKLQVIGVRLQFMIGDYVSTQPISGAKLTFGSNKSISDKSGMATLVVPPTSQSQVVVSFGANGYHSQTIMASTDQNSRQTVKLIPSQLDYFISNRDGKYGLYSAWLDGSNVERLLPGSGLENPKNMSLTISPDNQTAMLVSTRDGVSSPGGNYQQELFRINLQTSQPTKVDQGNITPIGWAGDWFVYRRQNLSKAYNDPAAEALMSYNYKTNQSLTLDQTNNLINMPQIASDKIFFAPNDIYNSGADNFFSQINPDGSGMKQLITNKIVIGINRLNYTQLQLNLSDGSTEIYDTASGQISSGGQIALSQTYYPSPDSQSYAFVDERDGQPTLLANVSSQTKTLAQIAGLSGQVHWLDNNTLVFGVSDDSGSFDYVVSTQGGQAQKITSVSNIGG